MRGAGEIVEVQGGHIVRSIGRKDRHSKVCTAKGPRDRRVRLAAHTAIQFYDVQDRLGYDRPSKAVDWLIQNAKAAIANLDELPAWNPSASNPQDELEPSTADHPIRDSGNGKKRTHVAEPVGSPDFGFLPPSLDSDAIADTIKSFFPMATAPSSIPPIGYHNYPPDHLSRTSSQDLRLSLQSYHDPIFHHPNPTHHNHQTPTASGHHNPLGFDATQTSWASWNVVEMSGGGGGGGGYVFTVPPPHPPPPQAAPLHPLLGQSQYFTQRGTLQSSNSPSVLAWMDPMASSDDHQMHPAFHSSASSIGFASVDGFSGFRIPARIQGEEEQDGISDKPSSASHHCQE